MNNRDRRIQSLRYLADKSNLSFNLSDDDDLFELLSDFRLFNIGLGKKITNILRKKDDFGELDIHMFDYEYRIGKGRTGMRNVSVIFVQSKQLALPQMLMKPENIFNRIGIALGLQDIDFEEFPDFSNNYILKGEDEELIRDVMDEEVLKFFSVEKGWSVEAVGYYLVIYKNMVLLRPNQLAKFYKKALAIHEMLLDDWKIGEE